MYSFGEPTIPEEMVGWMDLPGPQAPGGTSSWLNSLDFKLQRNLEWGLTGFVPNRSQVRTEVLGLGLDRGGWRKLAIPGAFEGAGK